MCKKKQFKYCPSKIDKCMIKLIRILNNFGIKTVACCCGHGKYSMTIIVNFNGYNWEIISDRIISRKKKFYTKDKEGYYYIPEVLDL